jgi:hypothetical protein
MGYAEAMAKLGMRMTKTEFARAEANPKVTITPRPSPGPAAARGSRARRTPLLNHNDIGESNVAQTYTF